MSAEGGSGVNEEQQYTKGILSKSKITEGTTHDSRENLQTLTTVPIKTAEGSRATSAPHRDPELMHTLNTIVKIELETQKQLNDVVKTQVDKLNFKKTLIVTNSPNQSLTKISNSQTVLTVNQKKKKTKREKLQNKLKMRFMLN